MNSVGFLLEDAFRSFLIEDFGYGDVTTDALIDPRVMATGHVVCNQAAVVAGLEEAKILLGLVGCESIANIRDGERVIAQTKILRITGSGASLLNVERTLLNMLGHMSGVATATAELVELVKKTATSSVRVACTRKTLPGLRYLEKKAVELGGGDTHRLRLDDAVLIKDNHLSLAGSVGDCVRKAREKVSFTRKIEVEVTRPEQAVEAASAGADIVLLDNMKPEQVKKAVDILQTKKLRNRVTLEASGGITKDNLPSYAKTGVDVISVGKITHSAPSIDMSMEIQPAPAPHTG